ncbi:hypothetical protein ACVILL_003593 [Bradyrhizobium sp. USDA 3364]
MSFRFITRSIHAYLIDYPVAIFLIAACWTLARASRPQCGSQSLPVWPRCSWPL